MAGSKARARRAAGVIKEFKSWEDFINDLHRKCEWMNGSEGVESLWSEDIPLLGILPKNYTYLGEGASRIAIRASDGLVYKVSKSTIIPEEGWKYNSGSGQNAMEVRAYNELKGVRVKGIRLARTEKIAKGVNVAEYVEGKHGGEWDEATRKRSRPIITEFIEKCKEKGWAASDIYYDNIKVNKHGTFVVVDIGCFYNIDEGRGY